jgi:hypothetical protein
MVVDVQEAIELAIAHAWLGRREALVARLG